MSKKCGFTLIELLVVIAIIALLLSILLPSLKIAKEKANLIQCKANLKSYHTAMSLYLHDNEGTYPFSRYSLFDGRGNPSQGLPSLPNKCQWHNRCISPEVNPGYAGPVYTYLSTMKTSMCPTFRNFAKKSGHTACAIEYDPQYSYSQNNFLGDSIGVLKESQVESSSSVLLYVEETIWKISVLAPVHILNDTVFLPRHPLDSSFPGDTIATYHGTTTSKPNDGMGNGVFVDGHVDLCDPWEKQVINGLEFRSSYLLSYPKRGGKNTQKVPYF